jgi:hypothetical protein
MGINYSDCFSLNCFAILLQKRLYGDSWRAAVGKGSIVGILTAIPLPIASLTTLLGGVLGAGKVLLADKSNNQLLANK